MSHTTSLTVLWQKRLALLCLAALPLCATAQTTPNDLTAQIDAIEMRARGDARGALLAVDKLLDTPLQAPQRVALMTLRGLFLTDANRPEAARAEAAALDALSIPDGKAAALIVRANVQGQKDDLARALELAEQADTALPPQADPRQRCRLDMIRGTFLTQLGRLPDALAAYQNALALAELMKSPFRIQRAHDSMANVFIEAHEIDKALAANRIALQMAEALGDDATLSQAWSTRAYIASIQHDRETEMRTTQRALDFARKTKSPTLIETMLINLGDTHLKAGRYADALHYSEEAAAIAREVDDPHGLVIALANAGQAEIRLGRLDAGKEHTEAALASALKLDDHTQYATLLVEYGEALESAGDYVGAIKAYHRERRASHELAEVSRKDALLELDARYQSERKQREIEILNRDNALKGAQLHNRSLQQRIWLLAAGLLMTGLLAVGLLYRRVRDANLRLAESNRMLKVRSERDALTGLFNRRYFQEAMRTRSASGGFVGGLILLDIDHFKRVNDTYGHATGDAVITAVAQRLQDTMRESDLVVRWGGEEFLIAVGPMPSEQFDRLAERLLHAISRDPIAYGEQPLSVTISIGYASFPLAPDKLSLEWERGINQVDMALYIAKAQGRNRACGIREVRAVNEIELDEIERSFETAWRDGRVTLGLITGATAA